MTAELTHNAQVRAEWRKHWPLVLAAGFGFSMSALITSILGLFIEPWSSEFGWGRALMSSGVTMVSFATFFLSPFVGALIDRMGTRRIALPGIVLLALSIASLSLLDGEIWLWFAIWALFTVAALATQPTIWTAGVASAFDAGRGVALGLTVAGSALSQTIAPTLTNFLMEEYGWRMALRYIALGWGGIAFLLCFFLLRDGYDASRKDRSANQVAGAGSTLLHDAPGLSIPEAWRSGALWRIGISTFVTMIVTVAVLVHQIPILLDVGVVRRQHQWHRFEVVI